jgi:hypothetical protein
MKRRFSERRLRELRNEIPLEELIEEHLRMPVKRVSGRFRFSCPVCSGYDTSVLHEKNLARCFSCKKNFNAIDLTMSLTSLDFVATVERLEKYRKSREASESEGDKGGKPSGLRGFASMAEIVPKILPPAGTVAAAEKENPKQDGPIAERIDRLEKKIDRLSARLDLLAATIDSAKP